MRGCWQDLPRVRDIRAPNHPVLKIEKEIIVFARNTATDWLSRRNGHHPGRRSKREVKRVITTTQITRGESVSKRFYTLEERLPAEMRVPFTGAFRRSVEKEVTDSFCVLLRSLTLLSECAYI